MALKLTHFMADYVLAEASEYVAPSSNGTADWSTQIGLWTA